MGYIYKITNKINGKVYIGQTSRSIQKRWEQHVYESYMPIEPYKSLLHRAIKKYGEESFSVIELENCKDEDLNDREIYWIDYYKSYDDGYNLDRGGGGWRKCDDNQISELWNDGYSAGEIADRLGVNRDTITNHIRNIGVSKEEVLKRGVQRANKSRVKPVYQYDIDGNYIGEYQSIKEAEEAIGGIKIKVTQVKYKLYGGYQWRRFKADKIDSVKDIKIQTRQPKEVHQYGIDGKYIQSFRGSKDAAQYLHCSERSIRKVCDGDLLQTHGFQWRYEKLDKINPIYDGEKVITKPRAVYQYSLDGKYIQSFKSSNDAAISLNETNSSKIRRVCREEVKQAYGFLWRYYKVKRLKLKED